MNNTFEHDTFSDAYKAILSRLITTPDFVSAPRGIKCKELLNSIVTIRNPYENLFDNSYRGIPMKYLKNELALYFAGRNDAEGFANASKFWNAIKTPDEKINSAYGYLIFVKNDAKNGKSQWDWAYDSLVNDDMTRQAILHFNRPEHQYETNKDFVCTLNAIFHIRDNKLYMTIIMRSNDVRKGMQYDIPFFTILQQLMLNQLRQNKKYEKLEMGSYTHIVNSLHLYEADFEIAQNMLDAEFSSDKTPAIVENPILNDKIISISNGNIVNCSDEFINWLNV